MQSRWVVRKWPHLVSWHSRVNSVRVPFHPCLSITKALLENADVSPICHCSSKTFPIYISYIYLASSPSFLNQPRLVIQSSSKQFKIHTNMAFFLLFLLSLLASSATACNRCLHQSKASYFSKASALSCNNIHLFIIDFNFHL